MQATRVLVVEDNEVFSRFISLILQREQTFAVVGVIPDGLTAVQSADDLQPDLILLDIGLPGQNGIDAAQHILRVAPRSKIIFVTAECSPAVIWRALDLGACGYVLKSDAGSELLPAMRSALEETSYVSTGCREALASAVLSDRQREMQWPTAILENGTNVGV